MAKFTKQSAKPSLADTIFEAPVAVVDVVPVAHTRCGGCAYFIAKLDPNNPFDGFCHAFPPENVSTGFRWAKTASNEIGCGIFKKRG